MGAPQCGDMGEFNVDSSNTNGISPTKIGIGLGYTTVILLIQLTNYGIFSLGLFGNDRKPAGQLLLPSVDGM